MPRPCLRVWHSTRCTMFSGIVRAVCIIVLVVELILACQPPDCDHVDCGSCGTACCRIEFKFVKGFEDVHTLMIGNLKSGGSDSRYKFVNEEDYRKDDIKSGVQYQFQAIHTTMTKHYNDTLNFLIVKTNTTDVTLVEAFSISQVYDAYCDYGQNYKNLVGYVKGLGLDFDQTITNGCGSKQSRPHA